MASCPFVSAHAEHCGGNYYYSRPIFFARLIDGSKTIMIASQSRVRQSVCEMKEQETKRKSPEEQKTLNTPGAVCKKNFPNHVFIESLKLRGFQEYKNYLGQFLSMGLFQGHIYI
mmetsp:Transcript_101113/g.205173  ORF Transcript_101113/g.205173 Transcript_101113/m.205173 type:complete len:115 (-) Transcript_101113:87-431(-)